MHNHQKGLQTQNLHEKISTEESIFRTHISGGTKCGGSLIVTARSFCRPTCSAGTNTPDLAADNVSVTPYKLHKITTFIDLLARVYNRGDVAVTQYHGLICPIILTCHMWH